MADSEITVILHDIRSMENAGSIMRTCDAAGVSKVYFTGYTPAPLDRFGRKNAKLVKASLGAEEFVAWEAKKDVLALIKELRGDGTEIVSVELASNATPYTSFKSGKRVAYIFGNEVDGIPSEILTTSDVVIQIPMRGKKESLNVSVAAGIVLFSLQK